MTKHNNIYDLIVAEETNYKLPVKITENYSWGMYEHIKTAVNYKNSIFNTGKDDNKPFKNIVRPILNLQYRAEGFDVKDIILYINDITKYFKSFLVKKYHEKWAREEEVDTFIDKLVESFVDFGGALVKNTNRKCPEVVPLQRLAFCDQTALLSGPICEKHYYSPDELRDEQGKGWENVEEAITLSQNVKTVGTNQQAETPGKYIEVYEVHGVFPKFWLEEREDGSMEEDGKLTRQVWICTFYKDEAGNKNGLTLYKGPESKLPYKLILRDEIYGRALGLGGVEELVEAQVWTNYDVIRMKDMLDAASKIILKTTDSTIAAKHPTGLSGMQNLEVVELSTNTDIGQIDTFPRNISLFEKSVAEWEDHARTMGAAQEAIMGEAPASGTPFKSVEFQAAESHSLHKYRQGKLAVFVAGIYREWIIPYIAKEITNGDTFLSELSLEEMQTISWMVSDNAKNSFIVEKILSGEIPEPEEIEQMKQMTLDEFMKGGNKKFIDILEGELKNAPMDVEISIVGKQKDLSAMTDKLVNIFREIRASVNPQTGQSLLDDPRLSKLLNEILENSGLSPISYQPPPKPPQLPQGQQTNPMLPQGQNPLAPVNAFQ